MLPVTESQLLLTSPNVLLKSSANVMTHCSKPQDDRKKKTGSVADHVLLKLFCSVPENKIHAAALCCCYPLSLTCQPISHTAQALNRVWMVEIGEQTPSCSSMLCGGCLACSCTTKCYKSETELGAKHTWEALGCEGPDRGMKGWGRCSYNPWDTLLSISPLFPPKAPEAYCPMQHLPGAQTDLNTPCCLTFHILLLSLSFQGGRRWERDGKRKREAWKRRYGSMAKVSVRWGSKEVSIHIY